MPRERIRDPLIEGKSHKEHPGINLNNIVLWVNKDEENFSIKEGEKYGGPLFSGMKYQV